MPIFRIQTPRWSADQNLGPGIGHWHPHMMVFTPYYENSTLGGNEFGGTFAFRVRRCRYPFAVTLIPTDDGDSDVIVSPWIINLISVLAA